jgi:uncharacterized membrane protein YhaH (DUF805 family)
MNFPQAIKSCFKKYATFSGRAARSEYWYFSLFTCLCYVVATVLDISFLKNDNQPLNLIFTLVLFLPSLAVWVRRLHDINMRGWWALISLIPIIGIIVMLILACIKGTDGDNRFGTDPLKY